MKKNYHPKLFGVFSSVIHRYELHSLTMKMGLTFNMDYNFHDFEFGTVGLTNFNKRISTSETHPQNTFYSGQIFNLEELSKKYSGSTDDNNKTTFLENCMMNNDFSYLPELNGEFSAAFVNKAYKSVTIFCDRFGFFPLYYYNENDLFIFSSEMKAISAVVNDLTPDAGGYGQFFYIGHMIGNKTHIKEIKVVNTGEAITWKHNNLKSSEYWNMYSKNSIDEGEISTKGVYDIFQKSILNRVNGNGDSTILLSGGFDSRFVLATLMANNIKPSIMTINNDSFSGGLEGRIAKQVADYFGLNLDLRISRKNFYNSNLALEVFHILDGLTPTFELFISQVFPEIEHSQKNIWDGLGLDALVGGRLNAGNFNSNVENYLNLRTINKKFLKFIYSEDWYYQIEDEFIKSFNEETNKIPREDPDAWSKFLIASRVKRRISVNPHQLYNRKVIPLTPCTDNDFMENIFFIPFNKRINRQFYIRLYKEIFPGLLNIPFFSGGSFYDLKNTLETNNLNFPDKKHPIKNFIKRTGFNYYARILHGKIKGLDREKMALISPEILLSVLGETNTNVQYYNKKNIEKSFRNISNGNMSYYSYLIPAFYSELWNQLFLKNRYTDIRKSFFS